MGCCKTAEDLVNSCYDRFDLILSSDQQQQLRALLKSEQGQEKINLKQIVYPYFLGSNSQRGVIIYKKQQSEPNHILLFYGKVHERKSDYQGLIIFQNKTAFNGLYYEEKNTIRKISGILYDQKGQKVLHGSWTNNQFVQGQIFTHQDLTIQFNHLQFIVKYPDQSIYSGAGEIIDGKFIKSGKGKFQSGDGKYIYKGDWLHDMKNGHGDAYYTGDQGTESFKGYFVNDQKNGEGKYIRQVDNQQQIFIGKWKGNNKFKGKVIIQNESRSIELNWSNSEDS